MTSDTAEARDRRRKRDEQPHAAAHRFGVHRAPGIRFGADAMLNLLPGVGLVAAKGVSAYLIWEARRLGAPTGTLLRMVGNVALDAVVSAVPLAGWVGDVFFRANLRNMALLREHLARRRR